MKLPELSEVQFQASAQSKAFDPLQLPDPNPQLQQNLSAIQQSFANMAKDGYSYEPSFLEQFAELVPQAVNTAVKVQQVDVAIQNARADERYSQLLRSGALKESEVIKGVLDQSQRVDDVVRGQAADAAQNGAGIDPVQGILNLSNHGDIRLRQKLANHLVTNHYPKWAEGQRLTNDTEIQVLDENNNPLTVRINDQDQPIFIDRQIREHLRTAFMGHPYIADTNNEILTDAFRIIHKTDDQLESAYDKQYRAKVGDKQFTDSFNTAVDRVNRGDMKGLAAFFKESGSIWTKDGTRPMQRADFFQRFASIIKTTAENGAEYNIAALLTQAEFSDGQTMMQRAPAKAMQILREYRDARRTYQSNKLKADVQDLKFSIAEFGAPNPDDPKSVSDYVAFKTAVRERAAELGIDATDHLKIIDQQIRVGSYGAEELNQLREQAEIALATGNASLTADYYLNDVVRSEYGPKIEAAVKRIETPEYKINSKEISTTIGGATKGTMVDPLGQLKGQAIQVNAYYQRIFDDKYSELMEQNAGLDSKDRLTPKAIADQARDAAMSQWFEDSANEKHKYYVNPKNGNFDNFPVPAVDQAEVTQNSNVRTITSGARTQKGVLSQIAAQPSLAMAREIVKDAIVNFSSTGIIDPTLKTLQKKINNNVGKNVIENPMQIAIAAAQGYGDLKPGEVPQAPIVVQSSGTDAQARKWMERLIRGHGYVQPAQFGPVAQMRTRPGMPNVAPVFQGETPTGLTGLSANDYRELGFIVSKEAGPGDDKYAVAASVINRLAAGNFGSNIAEIARRPGQYEAVYTGKAFYDNKLIEDLASPEGQRKIAQMLILLDGRTDFKGQSQLKNRDPENDPMVDAGGNFYHYAGQTGMGPYTGTVNRNYMRFLK